MKFILTLFAFLIASTTFAQKVEDYISQANKFYQEKEYLKAGKLYEKALQTKTGDETDYYNAACCWALTGDTIKALNYLNKSIDLGNRDVEHLQKDSDLDNLHNTKGWKTILVKIKTKINEYEASLNQPLKKQLEKIYVKDQTLRHLLEDVSKKFGQTSNEYRYFWEVINREDSINLVEVETIIKKYGWVGKSEIGEKANEALWLVIQHADLATQEKYLPLLQSSVKKGESNPNDLALLEDRILMRNNKPQKYGSQVITNNKTGAVFYEIENPEYVNQRRKTVGLIPIEEYAKLLGIEWTIKQKEK